MATVADGLKICEYLSIDPNIVQGINIYVLHRQLEVRTTEGIKTFDLVPDTDEEGQMVLRIVKDAYCPICEKKMTFVHGLKISAKYRCPEHGTFVVGFLSTVN
jgi:hypothetical protein